jgi:hypothetical protein
MDRRRYFASLLFRLTLVVFALLLSVRAIYVAEGGLRAWFLAGLFGMTAALLQIRPLLVPNPGHASTAYTAGPAFFLAALFLIPAGPLIVSIACAVALSGLVTATRPHKILLHLAVSILPYGACSYFLHLGSRTADSPVPSFDLVMVELMLAATVLVGQLVLRSLAIRLERGDETPHWGAFQPQALTESFYCLALSVPVSVLTRIHPALLAVVYLYLGLTWWFMERYRRHVRLLVHETGTAGEDLGRWVA